MDLIARARMYGRFALGFPGFLRQRLSLEQAQEILRHRLARREQNLVRLVERGVYAHPPSPYLALLHWAGCELGDFRDLVAKEGVEEALERLRRAGVSVTLEQFKGRQPILRRGLEIPVRSGDFDNPLIRRGYGVESGGSSGRGTRVMIDLDALLARAPQEMLQEEVHGLLDAPWALWLNTLPGPGFTNVLARLPYGRRPVRWFASVRRGEIRPALEHRLANALLLRLLSWGGVAVPPPEPLGLDRAEVVADLLAELLDRAGRCVLKTHVSPAVRVCVAAEASDIDLAGASFLVSGEPLTPARAEAAARVGARMIPGYHFSEVGIVGLGCARPCEPGEVHVLQDHVAVVPICRQPGGSGADAGSLLLTTLLETAPKLLLNVESDDVGIVERRSCGCGWEAYGLTQHLRAIRSLGRLTGEGITVADSDLIPILEVALPERFGGSHLDYQLVEAEDGDGLPRLSLRVSPTIEISSPEEVADVFLTALSERGGLVDLAQAVWRQGGTLSIVREAPEWSVLGKLPPVVRRVGAYAGGPHQPLSRGGPKGSGRP